MTMNAPMRRMRSSEIVMDGAPKDSDRTVFVGNLSQDVDEVILYELFTQVGPVERITLPLHDDPGSDRVSHKGYAFVQFADGKVNSARHSVVYAMKVMNDIYLYGQRIRVSRSNSRAGTQDESLLEPPLLPGDAAMVEI
ncbi:hypothetical protein GUITHDRAFT_116572 [Guillardia theta CCMP2712]|uniref:RRM domain-containing protein n=2 Tax=Guillardia theta TaxID=55529 RepID=L1IM45_GUITC|nr:hypothetical protein GUITHDRAFT_116572 [Guillardia theta CCMP2712]EKX37306.1 hypothetical protein GUITHDRAFT_116572 [Guillardia theta CCMP2712]|eukprot:XP_005824286.1 hypothetical protein GUITHDRAFT_116572 [Guillardia theta CCMP2712]